MQKTTKILLIIASFMFLLAILSNTIDNDLGWHLRFGQDALLNNFQFTDSYTWGYYGQDWVNHEWGGSILAYIIYSNFGHIGWSIFITSAILAGFFIITKTFQNKLNISSVFLSIILLYSIKFALVSRLAMLVIPFFALIIYTLETLPNKKYYCYWPIIFWVWASLHGSWILGFIIINIYVAGVLLQNIIKKYNFKFLNLKKINWDIKIIYKIILWQVISGLIILINPYTYKIYLEVINYFNYSYFKQFITEWLPSYAYPVYWLPLIFFAICLGIILKNLANKKITLPQILVFLAIFYAAWENKRHNILLITACLPILSLVPASIKIKQEKIMNYIFIIISILLIISYFPKINFEKNIWQNESLIKKQGLPYDAVKFLQTKNLDNKTKIFNEFWWGAYLNWNLPESLVYFDGRGTATWKNKDGEFLLKKYREIKFEIDGLGYLEKNAPDLEYIILEKNKIQYTSPNFIDKIVFPKNNLDKLFKPENIELEENLKNNNNWQKIYEDDYAIIWKKL